MVKIPAGRIIEWVRPHVPESSDGILTSAGICEGFAGGGVGSAVLIFAGLVAGTLAMGAVEYSKLRVERDQQVAQLAKERVQIETAPDVPARRGCAIPRCRARAARGLRTDSCPDARSRGPRPVCMCRPG